MASNNQIYAILFVNVDGALLSQEGSVTIDRSSNSQPIKTVVLGYAGESPGAAMTEVSVNNVMPAAGMELDAGKNINGLIPSEIGIEGPGGKVMQVNGFIVSDSISHSVDNPSAYSFRFRGPFAQFQ